MKKIYKIGAILLGISYSWSVSAYEDIIDKLSRIDPMSGAEIGAGIGMGAAAISKTPIVPGMGMGALLGYLLAVNYAQQPMEYFFKDTSVTIMDDAEGTHLLLPADLVFKSPNKDIIDAKFYPVLNKVVELLEMYPDIQIAISGHTDDIMQDVQNEFLSQQYAKLITDYLLSNGVDGRRIIAVRGAADRESLHSNRTSYTRYANRRIEVTLLRTPTRSAQSTIIANQPSPQEEPNVVSSVVPSVVPKRADIPDTDGTTTDDENIVDLPAFGS